MTLDITGTVWVITLALIAGLFALDLGTAIRRPHVPGFRESVVWTLFYIGVAIAFGAVFWLWAGSEFGTQFYAGYIVEKTLSVDNLFVFVIIMSAFAVPPKYQQKLLILGIALALILRAIFIAVGAALLAYFAFMFLLFGLLLVYTGIALYRHRDEDPDVSDNLLVKGAKKVLTTSDTYHEGHFFVRLKGKVVATPLFIALIAIGDNRSALRAGFDPGRIRGDFRAIHRVRRQCLRAAGPSCVVLPRQRTPGPTGVLVNGIGADSGLHWGQARLALGAWHLAGRPRGIHRVLAAVHLGGPCRNHGRKCDCRAT